MIEHTERRFLFLLSSARRNGNAETLARRAAAALSRDVEQTWLRLADLPLPAFDDIRHSGDGVYPEPEGHGLALFDATLHATDLVFVVPLYWYGLPAPAKLYLDHWSGWMRVPGRDFRRRIGGKTMWAISAYSDDDPKLAQPMFDGLKITADYMVMRWGGSLLGRGNRPGDIETDADGLVAADNFFASVGQYLIA